MRISPRHTRKLRPYLIGEPKPNGEWDMICPLHEDVKRSASLNVLTGEFFCQAESIGMGVTQLMALESQWIPPGADVSKMNGSGHRRSSGAPETVTEGKISGWQSALMSSDDQLDELMSRRGLTEETLERFQIGWDPDRKVYTIPVRGDDGEIWNVRRYTFNPKDEDSKIRSVTGMRVTELYPVQVLKEKPEFIIICEGEWDALATIQNGYPALTKTSGTKTWRNEWSARFEGMKVYICHDRDHDGQAGARKIAQSLQPVAEEIRVIDLPYEIIPKHGKDLTDYWAEHDRGDFEQLLFSARIPGKKDEADAALEVITVLDSFDSQKVARPVQLAVTIKGKKDPGYSVPKKVRLSCTRDRGIQCNYCSLKTAGGNAAVDIAPANPLVLGMIDAPISSILQSIIYDYGVPGGKCAKLTVEIEEHQAVEQLFARPSIDHGNDQKGGADVGEYKNIKITSVGRHDTLPNNTVLVTGALFPNPRTQSNEFLAWEVERQETSIDRFELTSDAIKTMKRFQPRKGQRPLRKLGEINKDLSAHVTRIRERPEMHALMDLTFHSILAWKFSGDLEERGWLQSMVIGDTRTGKSQVAQRYIRHFGGGEWVGGENVSLAGLIGGLQQIGGKDWAVTWGVIPLNDRRIVVIDEFPHPEDISKMSATLSSGVAKIQKIQQDMTLARTRTLWMGNPPQARMANFTYGVDAFRSIITTPEDIARFDLAMAVADGDVDEDIINTPAGNIGEMKYTAEACHTMLMWCWTRRADDVVWARGAENAVYKAASAMGKRYVEDPPLVQAANIRIKIARVAVALAARTFSTDASHQKVVVTTAHVEDAVKFMDMLYNMPTFGYAERSRERILDLQEAEANRDDMRNYLLGRRQLAKFLRTSGKFRRQDLEEILNFDRDQANAVISTLYNARMVRKQGTADIYVEPVLHGLLREVRW